MDESKVIADGLRTMNEQATEERLQVPKKAMRTLPAFVSVVVDNMLWISSCSFHQWSPTRNSRNRPLSKQTNLRGHIGGEGVGCEGALPIEGIADLDLYRNCRRGGHLHGDSWTER